MTATPSKPGHFNPEPSKKSNSNMSQFVRRKFIQGVRIMLIACFGNVSSSFKMHFNSTSNPNFIYLSGS